MMRSLFILLLFFFCGLHATAQKDTAKTNVYFELFGNGGLYSINVERALLPNFYARAGFGTWASDDLFGAGKKKIVTFPIMGNYLFGEGSSKLEIGAGILLGWSRFTSTFGEENDNSQTIFNLTGVVGYRYQKPGGGFIGRIGLTPFFAMAGGEEAYPDPGFLLSGGISVGYSF